MPRRTANDHQGIGRHPDLGIALYRIPEQIAGNEHIRPVAEDGLQPLLDQDDPVELDGVLANRLTITFRVDNLGLFWRRDEYAHDALRASWSRGRSNVSSIPALAYFPLLIWS